MRTSAAISANVLPISGLLAEPTVEAVRALLLHGGLALIDQPVAPVTLAGLDRLVAQRAGVLDFGHRVGLAQHQHVGFVLVVLVVDAHGSSSSWRANSSMALLTLTARARDPPPASGTASGSTRIPRSRRWLTNRSSWSTIRSWVVWFIATAN